MDVDAAGTVGLCARRAFPASAPESPENRPRRAARSRARPAPPRPPRGLCAPHAGKPARARLPAAARKEGSGSPRPGSARRALVTGSRPGLAAPAALRCGPKGGSNPWAVPAGDRGPLSCEFSQNSGVGVSPQKSKLAALFRTAVCIENGEGQAHACHLDHTIPHRGDMRLFWDESNWQALCESWHDHKIGHEL